MKVCSGMIRVAWFARWLVTRIDRLVCFWILENRENALLAVFAINKLEQIFLEEQERKGNQYLLYVYKFYNIFEVVEIFRNF